MNTQENEIYEDGIFIQRSEFDKSGNAHRQLLGITGMLLPVALFGLSATRPISGIDPYTPLGSLSAYYYTGAAAAFSGILVAIALNLLTYRGYEEPGSFDRPVAIIAGCAAIVVVLFPTGAPTPLHVDSWWTPAMGVLHYAAAAVLFAGLAVFCLLLFPRTQKGGGIPTLQKRRRNYIYYSCGALILVGMVWAYLAARVGDSIFLPESVAVEAFAISWLTKGRIIPTAKTVGLGTVNSIRAILTPG
ncbi:MAG TPA: hypothetical protein PLC98_16110 [Anaerolineales bacterium]|nr:hypothetical protein [Anaerolineales bacterium]